MTKPFPLCHLEIWQKKIPTDMKFDPANSYIKISTVTVRQAYKTLKTCHIDLFKFLLLM